MPLRFAFHLFKHGSLWAYRLLTVALLAGALLFAIVVLLLRYWVLPHIDDYREYVVEGLSRAAHLRVQIGRIEGDWDGFRPRLILREVHLLDAQGQERLKLEQIDSTLSWLSLFAGELRFSSIELEHLRLEIRRERSGRLLVAGIAVDESGTDGGLSEWLLAQHRVVVRDSHLTWIDERLGGAPLELEDVQVLLEQLFWTHRFGLRAKPPIEVASRIDIRGELRGRSFGDPLDWSGQIYLGIAYVDLAALRQWLELPMRTTNGSGSLQIWGGLLRGRPREITADVALSDVATRLGDDVPELRLSSLRGRLGWRSDAGLVKIWARGLSFATPDGLQLPPADISYSRTRSGAGRPLDAEIAFDALPIDAMSRLVDRLPVDPTVRSRLAEVNPRGRLRDFRVRWREPFSWSGPYKVSGGFQDIAVNASGRMPGITHLTGSIDATERGGSMVLDAPSAVLDMPTAFAAPLLLDTLQAKASWSISDGLPKVALERVAVSNKFLTGEVSGRYEAVPEGPGVIDVSGRLTQVSGPEAWRYVPVFVPGAVSEWLHRAIVSGTAHDVRLTLRGDLRHFPWGHGEKGVFEAAGPFTDGTVAFATGWPRLEGLQGRIAFRGSRVEVAGSAGGAFGARLSSGSAVIPDLDSPDPRVEVRGEVDGPTSDFLRYVQESPIEERIGEFIDGMRASGRGHMSLRVDTPLHKVVDTQVSGAYAFSDNTLDPGEGLPVLGQLSGKLMFTRDDVSLRDGAARVYGGPARFSMARDVSGAVRIQANGRLDVAQLRREIDQALLGYLTGAGDWRMTATVREHRHEFVIDSNLLGIASSLPAPFAKSAQESVRLRVERRAHTRSQDLLSFAYGDVAAGQMLLDKTGNARISRGEIVLGGGGAALPQRDGLWLAGTLDRFDADQWWDLFSAHRAGAADGGVVPVAGINVSAPEVRAFSRDFHDVHAIATQRDGAWIGKVESREISGDARWLPEGDGMIVGRFSRLYLPVPTVELEPAPAPGAPDSSRGRDLPSIDLAADDFRMGPRQFGKLVLMAVPNGADWRIERLELTSPDGAFSVTGLWQAWAVDPRTRVSVKLEVSDIGRFFARMALPPGMAGGKAKLEGQLSWAGPPYALDLPTLSGQLALTARKGRFLKIDPGIGKLLAVLSLQTLPKVVTLDLRDVFGQGFAFEDISAKIDIAHGVAHTQNFEMDGAAARVKMSGEVNLASETQQLDVHIYPSMSESVALGTALVNPAIGLGALVLQKALKDPLGQILGFSYRLAGTWTAPIVTKKKPERNDLEPGRK
ncbi:MAG TPA: YhdP family protein [Burkholderiales bacterium]|nr:YhdP family protein [Burkholderiales bacterium]